MKLYLLLECFKIYLLSITVKLLIADMELKLVVWSLVLAMPKIIYLELYQTIVLSNFNVNYLKKQILAIAPNNNNHQHFHLYNILMQDIYHANIY